MQNEDEIEKLINELEVASGEIKRLFVEILDFVERIVLPTLLNKLPNPILDDRKIDLVYTYTEKDLKTAVVLKLVQIYGNIKGGMLLIENGLFFEWGVLIRTLYDALNDTNALIYVANDMGSKFRKDYLDFFWDEDFDESGNMKTLTKIRGSKRQNIRRVLEQKHSEYTDAESLDSFNMIFKELNQLYSGYTHGKGTSILRSYQDGVLDSAFILNNKRSEFRRAMEYGGLYAAVSQFISILMLSFVSVDGLKDIDLSKKANDLLQRFDEFREVTNSLIIKLNDNVQ